MLPLKTFALTGLLTSAVTALNVPFSTSGRWIHDSTGANFTYIGANWPGAADTMLPEGLQYQSVKTIVSTIKSLGFNIIRLTFAIEMIDDIYSRGSDVPISETFNTALGSTNGPKILAAVLKNNPSFTASTTRLQVFDAVAAECAAQGIYVHLDNHISKAEWCCSTTDGNAWFGDTYFNVANWKRGLQYMANHGKSWSSLVSIGMRNELRSPDDNSTLVSTSYNWANWYTNMVSAASTINTANPNLLIFYSGLNYDTTLAPIPTASDLGNGQKFLKSSFSYSNKMVLELHNYQNSATSCSSIKSGLYTAGFNALDTSNSAIVNIMPVVLTEFGYSQDASGVNSVYATCLKSYIPSLDAGWMVWVLAGSYYIRSGTQDYDESWGLLNHDWSGLRNSTGFNSGIGQMISLSEA